MQFLLCSCRVLQLTLAIVQTVHLSRFYHLMTPCLKRVLVTSCVALYLGPYASVPLEILAHTSALTSLLVTVTQLIIQIQNSCDDLCEADLLPEVAELTDSIIGHFYYNLLFWTNVATTAIVLLCLIVFVATSDPINQLREQYVQSAFYEGQLETLKWTGSSDECCSICLSTFGEEAEVCRVRVCGHTFHSECLGEWLNTNQICPNCRRHIL